MADGSVNRRDVLTASGSVAIIGLAGCTSGDSSNDENGNSNEDSDDSNENSGTDLTDILTIEDHEWRGTSLLEVKVRNQTSDTLDLVQVEADVYVGDERINHSYTNISSLPGETVETSEIRFTESYDRNPCEADRYELVPNFYYENEDYEKRMEYEFNQDFCE
ncbi:hypothetical protein EGH24_09690 [Halonotius terrestris]|uniref:Uncharacterized protein n=1 Tax=Halonotius terrestris TaxID=2487750 RepID=A0A8J8P6H0_9EURY|nr:hypothetical protein [Halonotius terrestris]TQQ79763.1 hypothetical protein EGH24_09690 [Halonotius terrestris]